MKFITSIFTLFIFSSCMGQVDFRYFTVTSGEKTDCANQRGLEAIDMIEDREYSLLEVIYPKLTKDQITVFDSISTILNSFESIGNSGATKIDSKDSSNIVLKYFVYKKTDNNLDDLVSLTFVITQHPPYLLDTIICGDTIVLKEEIRENLVSNSLEDYVPLPPKYTPWCFGGSMKFQLVKKNGAPHLNAPYYGIQRRENPNLVRCAEGLGVPIVATVGDGFVDPEFYGSLENLNNVRILRLKMGKTTVFPRTLLQNNEIEIIELELPFASLATEIFEVPKEISNMQSLIRLQISSAKNQEEIVKLPRSLQNLDKLEILGQGNCCVWKYD